MCKITKPSIIDTTSLTNFKRWKGLSIWIFLLHFPLFPFDMRIGTLHCTYLQKKEEQNYQKENIKSYMVYTIILCGYICEKLVRSDHT